MTEMFVSGTEVFSHVKMTESPYEWRRVDMYECGWCKFSSPALYQCIPVSRFECVSGLSVYPA